MGASPVFIDASSLHACRRALRICAPCAARQLTIWFVKNNAMAKSNYGSDIKRKMKRDRNKRIIRTLVEVVLVLLASAAVAFLFFSSVMIQENSMSPTLMAGAGERTPASTSSASSRCRGRPSRSATASS